MKRIFILTLGLLMAMSAFSQSVQRWTEDFDGAVSFNASPANSWVPDVTYYMPSSSATNPKSYLGLVPTLSGSTTILETDIYDCRIYDYVVMQFSHICKVSPFDTVSIEYRTDAGALMGQWKSLPRNAYTGKSTLYPYTGYFNASSYPEWQADDNLAFPSIQWWKEEIFDLYGIADRAQIQFRFIIKHGPQTGTHVAYGWLLDNFQLTASSYITYLPDVRFVTPLVQGEASGTGPWEINAIVKTRTSAAIENPTLNYRVTYQGSFVANGSELMTMKAGDSLWKATIPAFMAGSEVLYFINGKDLLGNQATALSSYYIQAPQGVASDFIYFAPYDSLAGGSTQIFMSGYRDSRSRFLYLNSEFTDLNPVNTLLTSIAFRLFTASTSNRSLIRVYLKATSEMALAGGYVNPVAVGATLVYEGPMTMGYPYWLELPFNEPFTLPVGSNLLLFVEDYSPNTPNCSFRGETGLLGNTDLSYLSYQGAPFYAGVLKPILRIRALSDGRNQSNSVALESIDIKDTIAVASGLPIPIVVSFKNTGKENLTSIDVAYSINGQTSSPYNWTGNLPWDFAEQDTIGYYIPKENGKDTLIVWVSNPNGVTDTVTWNDTLTKVILNSSDIQMYFVETPADTLHNSGPFGITADIRTVSGATLGNVLLNISSTLGGIPTVSTVPVNFNANSNLWEATIPHVTFGSHVAYSITLTDILNNTITIADSFYVDRLADGVEIGYIIIGTNKTANYSNPISLYYGYSFSRQLYMGGEFSTTEVGGIITKLAWDYAYNVAWNQNNQKCYMRAVDEDAILTNDYIDPLTDGATLVWQGSIGDSVPGWVEITLTTPFVLPPRKNLMVYWTDESGAFYSSSHAWNYTVTANNTAVYGENDNSFLAATTGTRRLTNTRPNARFNLISSINIDTSVSMVSIESPLSSSLETSTPVRVRIRNNGKENLKSCILNWTLNGNSKPSVPYHGDLPEDFTDTITLGHYMPVADVNDVIKVWVTMPNGIVDPVTYDDTLQVTSIGCSGNLSGVKTVGIGGDYATLANVVNAIRTCGIQGNLTLQLKGTFAENMDLSNLNAAMNGFSLTITSLDNHPDSAVIKPASGVGILLGNNRNITLRAITVDDTAGTYAVQFTNTCTNIVIRDCKLLANPILTASGRAPIYKGSSTGMVDNISIINNLLDGGYYGVYFYGGIGYGIGEMGTNVILDSNTISNQSYCGIYPAYTNFASISYNTILSRRTNTSNLWYGINFYYANAPVIANRIIQRSDAIINPYGIYLYNYNYNPSAQPPGKGLVANNEIILNTTSTNTGINVGYYTRAEVIHNSIYISGTGAARGIYIDYPANSQMNIKNNNIVMTSPTAHPIYLGNTSGLNLYDIDYNNIYAPVFVGYCAGAITNMLAWSQQIPTDIHSIRVLPEFLNPSSNLTFGNPVELFTSRIISTPDDIDGTPRANPTSMGCYEGLISRNVNAMLTEISGIRQGSVLLQSDSVNVTIYNTGFTPLSSISLGWSINGIEQTTTEVDYPIALNGRGQSVILSIGEINYSAVGNMDIKVWIKNVNQGALIDEDSQDDTISRLISICIDGYSGTLTVGTSQNTDFKTITQAYEALLLCGLKGDVTLSLEAGVYAENLNFSNTFSLLSDHILTITSANHVANSVIIRPISGVGVSLGNTRNLVLKAITIDVATNGGANAILFSNPCTNIVVRDCRLLTDTVTTVATVAPVYKATGTGIVDSIFFINNLLGGGYYGFYFYGGIGVGAGQFGTHVVFDSNMLTNNYASGTYPYYVDYTSCSYNTVLSRTANTTAQWMGIRMQFSNGDAIGNTVIQRSAGITNPYGIYLYYYNYYLPAPQKRALVANNEIIVNTTGAFYGIHAEVSKAEIVHNSIYVSGAGAGRGINIANSANNNLVIKNNNIVMTSSTAYPIYFSATGNLNLYDVDYNNMYAPAFVGYYGANISTITDWQIQIATDFNSVAMLPIFVDTLSGLELSIYNDTLRCPSFGIQTDKKGIMRSIVTTMGAYTQPPAGRDLMLLQITSWSKEVIENQTIPITVDLLNMGAVPITAANFRWTLNGVLKPVVPWTTSSPLSSLEQRNIPIATFPVTDKDTFAVVVWVETINGQQDTVHWNDTVSATSVRIPLIEFVAPFVRDTIYSLDFDVHAKISTLSGAQPVSPQLQLEILIDDSYFLHDSVAMILVNGIWRAKIPQLYYKSMVIYSLSVSDTAGNALTITDSVYINFMELGKTDTVVIGTGLSADYSAPISMNNNYSWSRQLYLYSEVSPDRSPAGTYVTKIAWQSIAASAFYTNQTCYMRAIDDSVVTVNYLDPALNGFTSVWSGSLIILPGWVEITLDAPFFLPAGKNLEVVWNHRHGSFTNNTHTWAHSQTTNLMTAFAQNNTSFPLSSGATSYYRPNIKLDTKAPFVPYQVKNLGLIALPSPSNSLAFGCEPDYSTVSLIVGNLGAVDYDFSNDSLVIHLEIVDPFLTKSTEEIVISTGILLSGTQDVLELMSAFPIKYAGRYEIKAWVENALDNIPYDDTLFYLYTSGRIGLPVDEDFSGTILPDAFISTPVIGTDVWETYDDPLSPVMPFYGTGTLRYVGVQGSMAQLSIRQLDLNGSINPKLEFWYYHDSAASDMDRSYTDVNVIADGVLTTELSMFRKDVPNGWKYYFVDLTPYVGKECVLIEFVATNRFGTTSAQYIDRITVISTPDLAVSSIVVSPEISVCSLTNKDVSVTLNTIVNQEINFSNSGCNLAIEVPNYPPFIVSLQGSMIGNSSRTITIPNIDFSMGKHLLKAYLTVPVDNYSLNDTAYLEIEIRPELSLTTKSLTGGIDCFKIGADVQQEITLVNTGNMDLSNIALTVQIDTGETGSPTYAFYNETYTDTIHVGDSITYTFSNTYKAPSSATYYVRNTAYLLCDPLLVYVIDAITECSDIHDLAIVRLDNPSALRDVVGTSENVAVSITNMSDVKNFDNVNIMLMIEDENGLTISSRIGIIPSVGALSTLSFTFNEAYIVPDSAVYYIRVYLSSVDNYPENDTLFEQRTTTTVDITSIATADNLTLGQNIPNPAANATRIDYSIPEADEVIFELYSISGQLLYSRTIEAVKGKQSLEINTSTLSSGIYFYTVEYRGQRLVKRMSVNRK